MNELTSPNTSLTDDDIADLIVASLNGMRGRKGSVTTYVLKFQNGYRMEIDRELATLISPDGRKSLIGAVNYATLPEKIKTIASY